MKQTLVCMFVLLSVMPAAGAEISSPRVERLRAAVKENPEAIAQFWQEVQAIRTPLIERTSDGDDVLVTFLWRGNANLSNVNCLRQCAA